MPSLAPGTRVGPYEITAAIGSGGMGAVYSARDTRLNRDVALKLLPDEVAGDADRLARFRREAQALAAVNHPNIAQIYGIEDTPSRPPALVMELVPGRTLAEVIRDGPTPWHDVIPIARQVAEALECAHESGIVHRDLKPSNIKIRDERLGAASAGIAAGAVKVLDFGLAKIGGAAGAPGLAPDAAATVTSPAVTEMGVILGTAAYMAPEQARGRPVDKRADIWAFGVVAFELLTGRSLFTAGSVTDTIASVIKDDPDLGRLPADTPPALRQLIARCLVRDPAARLRDIGEARILLSGSIDAAPPAAAALPPARRGRWMVAGTAALVLAAAAAIAAWWLKPEAPPPPIRRLEIPLPADVTDYAISNDGTRLAYLAGNRLYVRRFDELEAADLGAMHVTARQLLWSPDDRTIAFTAEATLRSIPADGGPVFVVTKIPASGTAMDLAWLPDGNIAFSVWRNSLYAVPAAGGTAEVRVPIDAATEIDFHHLSALPDGRLIVAIHQRQDDRDVIELIDVIGPAGETRRVRLTEDGSASAFEYVPAGSSGSGLLIFRRVATNPGIWALPFAEGPIDVNRAALLQAGATDFRVARDGTLVALIPAPDRQALVWVDDRGVESPVPGGDAEAPEGSVEISPDGRRAAYVVGRYLPAGAGAGSLTNATVLVRDLESGVTTRLNVADQDATMWGTIGQPTWFPDGLRLLHRMGRIEGTNLVERRADIAGPGRVVTPGAYGRVLADGRALIVGRDERGTVRLARTTIGDDGTAGAGTPLFTRNGPPDAGAFDVSADGRLIAYVVRQPNGRGDIFLAPLAAPDEQYLVQEGGNRPRFTRDGSSLLFVRGARDASGQPRGEIVRVSVGAGPPIAIGAPVVVFGDSPGSARIGTFDTSPDGRRFLMWKPVPRPGEGRRLVLVEHAIAGVR